MPKPWVNFPSPAGIEAGINGAVQGPALAIRCLRQSLLVLDFTFGRLLILCYLFVWDLTEARLKSEFKCIQFSLALCRVKFLNLAYCSQSFFPGLVRPWSLKPHDPPYGYGLPFEKGQWFQKQRPASFKGPKEQLFLKYRSAGAKSQWAISLWVRVAPVR